MTKNWARLGVLIRRARDASGLNAVDFARKSTIPDKTLLRLVGGHSARTRSLVGTDRGFGWPLGTTEDILAGADLPATPIDQNRPKSRAELEIEASAVLTRREKDAVIE